MEIYPALRSELGSWVYYTVRMTARELATTVNFAYEYYKDVTLDQAMQRILNEGRVKKEIVQYLKNQPARFFSSLVVAAVDGNPQFFPVEIADNPEFSLFKNNKKLSGAFGVLVFDGDQRYYAIDGQHRLKAIKTLLDRDDPLSEGAPDDFKDDEFSVLIVVPQEDDSEEDFKQKYRRLFSNLNRYAKAMDEATNIIMDEDDAFAICTRRLITDHPFFTSSGRQKDSTRIKTTMGKNLRADQPHFTSLQVLYQLNKTLLSSPIRRNQGWGPAGSDLLPEKEFVRYRPDEDYIDQLHQELTAYWDGILKVLPVLNREPGKMRRHDLDLSEGVSDEDDNLLFWPIGQELFADLVRKRLDELESKSVEASDVAEKLRNFGGMEWRLHAPPWRNLLLVKSDDSSDWKMRSEDRKPAIEVGKQVALWLLGDLELDEEEEAELRERWKALLLPPPSLDQVEKDWKKLQELQSELAAG